MIHVDISNIWGELSLPDLLSIEAELSAAHFTVSERTGAGKEFLGWLELADRVPTAEHLRILAAAQRIRETSDILVVIGIGGSYLGSRAAIELLQGPHRNLRRSKGNPRILYAGNNLSTRAWNELTRLLEGRDFSLCVISKSGTTIEPAIAFRNLKWLLERRYGTAQAKRRIYAVTDGERGLLREMADREGWDTYTIPADVGGRFSVLSPAGLLPMAAAGVDILRLLKGAAEAREQMELRSFENPVWLYAAVRTLMERRGKAIELLESFEPGFAMMGRWWQQLFGSGVPVSLCRRMEPSFCGEHGLDTMLRFTSEETACPIAETAGDPGDVNFLAGRTLPQLEEEVWDGLLEANLESGVPALAIQCGAPDACTLGWLFWLFRLSAALCARLANPDSTGLEEMMLRHLVKPES